MNFLLSPSIIFVIFFKIKFMKWHYIERVSSRRVVQILNTLEENNVSSIDIKIVPLVNVTAGYSSEMYNIYYRNSTQISF